MRSLVDLPRVHDAATLAEVEAVPLGERGLAGTTYELLTRAARRDPDAVACVWIPDVAQYAAGVEVSFEMLLRQVDRTANVFAGLGVGRGDAVTLSSTNVSSLLAAILGAQAVGIAAPVNPGLSIEHTVEIMRTTGSDVVVAAGPELDPDLWERWVGLAPELGVRALIALRPDSTSGPAPTLDQRPGVTIAYLEDLCGEVPAHPHGWTPPRPEDLAAYFHTGGTTGAPKVAAHTHANEAFVAWDIAVASTLEPGDCVVAGLPLFHVNALLVTALSPLVGGASAVWPSPLGYRDQELYSHFWKLVEHYRARAMSAVPTIYAILSHFPVDADISSLTTPVVGAAPLPEAVRAAWHEHTGVELCEGYGLTEATCATSATPTGSPVHGSVGQRLPYQQVKAVRVEEDGTWHDLDPGEVGELVISGPAVFAGYLVPGPEGSSVPSTAGHVCDGWLRTGDIGAVDADQRIFLKGRSKDLIIRGGHNIDPAVIEEVLLEHPDVSAAGAVGRPDRHAGEVPVAFVVPRPGLAPADLDVAAVLEFSHMRITEGAARPRTVTALGSLPVTDVGKPFKPALREQAALALVREQLEAAGLADLRPAAAHHGGRLVVSVAAGESAAEVRDALAGFSFELDLKP